MLVFVSMCGRMELIFERILIIPLNNMWFSWPMVQRVNLSKLETTTLWRYWRHFNLVSLMFSPRNGFNFKVNSQFCLSSWSFHHDRFLAMIVKQVEVSPNPSKEQLVHAVERHFISQVLKLYLRLCNKEWGLFISVICLWFFPKIAISTLLACSLSCFPPYDVVMLLIDSYVRLRFSEASTNELICSFIPSINNYISSFSVSFILLSLSDASISYGILSILLGWLDFALNLVSVLYASYLSYFLVL